MMKGRENSPNEGSSPSTTLILGSIFAIVGFGLLTGAGFVGHRRYAILKTWPSVEAAVIRSGVTRHRSSSSTSTMYGVEMEFRYRVNGTDYITPTSLGYTTSSYSSMKRKAEKYGPGTRHLIRYNPLDPNDMRFNVGYNFSTFDIAIMLGGMGLVFSAFGVGLLIAYLRQSRLRCPSCNAPVESGDNFCPKCAAPLSIG